MKLSKSFREQGYGKVAHVVIPVVEHADFSRRSYDSIHEVAEKIH